MVTVTYQNAGWVFGLPVGLQGLLTKVDDGLFCLLLMRTLKALFLGQVEFLVLPTPKVMDAHLFGRALMKSLGGSRGDRPKLPVICSGEDLGRDTIYPCPQPWMGAEIFL